MRNFQEYLEILVAQNATNATKNEHYFFDKNNETNYHNTIIIK